MNYPYSSCAYIVQKSESRNDFVFTKGTQCVCFSFVGDKKKRTSVQEMRCIHSVTNTQRNEFLQLRLDTRIAQ